MDIETKLELVKLNLVVFGAVISAISLGVAYNELHILVGLSMLGIVGFWQYFSILPEYSSLQIPQNAEGINIEEEKLDGWYLVFGGIAYLFLLFGFVHQYILPESTAIAALPFIFAVLVCLHRLVVLDIHQTKHLEYGDQILVALFAGLLGMITLAILSF